MGFELHPQLAEDCHWLMRSAGAQILLHRNDRIPWYIVVPEIPATELHEIQGPARQQLDDLLTRLAGFLKTHHECEHTNVAAIGNRVPQLHVHIVGRWQGDPCWPDVVWGNLSGGSERSPEAIEALTNTLIQHLG